MLSDYQRIRMWFIAHVVPDVSLMKDFKETGWFNVGEFLELTKDKNISLKTLQGLAQMNNIVFNEDSTAFRIKDLNED